MEKIIIKCLNNRCERKLRVSTNRGKLTVRCPTCGFRFIFDPQEYKVPSKHCHDEEEQQHSRQDTNSHSGDELQLLQASTDDGRNILKALYPPKFNLDLTHSSAILRGFLNLLLRPGHDKGIGVDIDSGHLTYVPLFCRNIFDLVKILSNQLIIYEKCRSDITKYYRLPQAAVYSTSILMRQIVADLEARIKTPFRTELPSGEIDIDSGERKPQRLFIENPEQVVTQMKTRCQLMEVFHQIREIYDLKGVPIRGSALDKMNLEFIPAGGGEIV